MDNNFAQQAGNKRVDALLLKHEISRKDWVKECFQVNFEQVWFLPKVG